MWQDWTNAVLGLAVIGVAFIGLEVATLTWTLGILGAIIAIVGFWGAVSLGGSQNQQEVTHELRREKPCARQGPVLRC